MNVYTQLPQEYSFFMENAEQDCKYKNRWIFKYPDNWRTSYNREPIIGIRKIFTPKAYRRIEFNFAIERFAIDPESHEVSIVPDASLKFRVKCNMDVTKDQREIMWDFNKQYAKEIKKAKLEEKFNVDTDIWFDVAYSKHPNEDRLSYTSIIKLGDIDREKFEYHFQFDKMNDDARAVFNYYGDFSDLRTTTQLMFYDVWDRHDSMITSSLCSLNTKYYLGFSDEAFKPFKYFKLNNNTNEFWVEFWNSRNFNCPNILPADKKDGLIIEAVLLESGKEMS